MTFSGLANSRAPGSLPWSPRYEVPPTYSGECHLPTQGTYFCRINTHPAMVTASSYAAMAGSSGVLSLIDAITFTASLRRLPPGARRQVLVHPGCSRRAERAMCRGSRRLLL